MAIDTMTPEAIAASQAAISAANAGKKVVDNSDVGKLNGDFSFFLKMLTTQLKNQDPTEPMDATAQMAQLATFSQVEQTVKTNSNLESLLQRTSLQEADSVIGRTVTSEDGKISGVVKEVTLYTDGIVATLESGEKLVIGPGVKVKQTADE